MFHPLRLTLRSLRPGVRPLRGPLLIEEATLLEEFVEGDAGRAREPLERLLALIEHALRRRWRALDASHRDIIGACGVILVQ